MDFPRRILAFIFLVTAISIAQAQAQTIAADRIPDSMGVNVHLHHSSTLYYTNFPLVQQRLIELGVRHVRDGLIDTRWQGYYDRHNALGRAGIKGLFAVEPNQTAALFRQYPSRMADSFEAFEALNEYNQSSDPNWVATLRRSLTELRSLRNDPAMARYPVYGPSISRHAAYPAVGDVSSLIDYGNLHNYYSAFNPGTKGWGTNGYGSIDWNINQVRQISGNKPIVTTETGYRNDVPHGDALTPALAGKYMPRLVLEHFRKGILRTYLYELVDSPTAQSWSVTRGLLNSNGSPKPAFLAVKALLTLMADRGPAFTVRALPYTVTGASADVRHMSFQKRDGTYLLAIWIELPGYDVNAKRILSVPSQNVTITINDALTRPVRLHRWQDTGTVALANVPNAPASLPLTVTDHLTIVELKAAAGVPTSPTNLRVIP